MNGTFRTAYEKADGILIAAANGFSISEGFAILRPSAWFDQNFPELKKYGIQTPIQALNARYPNPEEYGKILQKMVSLIHFDKPESQVMKELKEITAGKPAFILTTNVEDRFAQAGYPEEDVFYLEGRLTHDRNGNPLSKEELAEIRDPSQLEIEGYTGSSAFQQKFSLLEKFVRQHPNLLILELGVGPNNQLIRPLLFQIMEINPVSRLFILNQTPSPVPASIQNRTHYVLGGLEDGLRKLKDSPAS